MVTATTCLTRLPLHQYRMQVPCPRGQETTLACGIIAIVLEVGAGSHRGVTHEDRCDQVWLAGSVQIGSEWKVLHDLSSVKRTRHGGAPME